MFRYYVKLAARNLRRNAVITALVTTAIAVGIGISMTTITIYHLMSNNPIPAKSDALFAIQMDSWDPNDGVGADDDDLPMQLTYIDTMLLRESDIPLRQAAMFKSSAVITTDDPERAPESELVRMTDSDFFALFQLRFLYGSGWDSQVDASSERVIVLSREYNDKYLGGGDTVGQTIYLDSNPFQVVGVVDTWEPSPKYYDVNNGAFDEPEYLFVPLSVALGDEQWNRSGNTSCWGMVESGWEGFKASECAWLHYWVELPDRNSQEDYKTFLDAHVMAQKELGRFPRPLKTSMLNVMDWLEYTEVVEEDSKVLVGLAVLFLAVCLFNAVGLLLAKFAGRASETGLRRALGASRRDVFAQHIIEVGFIGLVGGMGGLMLAWLGLKGVAVLADPPEQLVHLDPTLVGMAIGLSIVAALIAGLYPSWRVCRITPATYLKTQ